MNNPIDFVFTWVDNNDPVIQNKHVRYASAIKQNSNASETRFQSNNEILYAVASVLKFAPFANNIYIVTDEQSPDILSTLTPIFGQLSDKIKIIDHRIIFADHLELLPTFNSISIETMLHKIPGLADQFVYMNDDMIILKPCKPEDFFNEGNMIVRGKWRSHIGEWLKTQCQLGLTKIQNKPMEQIAIGFKQAHYNSAKLLGFKTKYLWHDHTPYPMRVSALSNYYATHEQVAMDNAKHRFRYITQFDPISLAYLLEIQNNKAILAKLDLVVLHASKKSEQKQDKYINKKLTQCQQPNNKFLCIQSLDQLAPARQQHIINWLDERILKA